MHRRLVSCGGVPHIRLVVHLLGTFEASVIASVSSLWIDDSFLSAVADAGRLLPFPW